MKVKNLGLVSYQEAYEIQKSYVEQVLGGNEEVILVCSHPSVVTLGKKSKQEDIQDWQGEVVQTERGGQATYHGPGQIIIYPILNLKNHHQNLSGFLAAMEESMISILKELELDASGNPNRGEPEYTGVWVGPYKVASIGVAVKRWVTYHGLALNVFNDPLAFKGINPCGFSSSTMTSMETLLKHDKLCRKNLEDMLVGELKVRFTAL